MITPIVVSLSNCKSSNAQPVPIRVRHLNRISKVFIISIFSLLLHPSFLNAKVVAYLEPSEPLHKAVFNNDFTRAQALLQKGHALEIPFGSFKSPLHRAVQMNHPNMARLLLIYGADTDVQLTNKKSMIDQALELGHLEIHQLLQQRQAEQKHFYYALYAILTTTALFIFSFLAFRSWREKKHSGMAQDHKEEVQRKEARMHPGKDIVHFLSSAVDEELKFHTMALDKSENGLRLICKSPYEPRRNETFIVESRTYSDSCYYEVRWCQRVSIDADIYIFGMEKKKVHFSGIQGDLAPISVAS